MIKFNLLFFILLIALRSAWDPENFSIPSLAAHLGSSLMPGMNSDPVETYQPVSIPDPTPAADADGLI